MEFRCHFIVQCIKEFEKENKHSVSFRGPLLGCICIVLVKWRVW